MWRAGRPSAHGSLTSRLRRSSARLAKQLAGLNLKVRFEMSPFAPDFPALITTQDSRTEYRQDSQLTVVPNVRVSGARRPAAARRRSVLESRRPCDANDGPGCPSWRRFAPGYVRDRCSDRQARSGEAALQRFAPGSPDQATKTRPMQWLVDDVIISNLRRQCLAAISPQIVIRQSRITDRRFGLCGVFGSDQSRLPQSSPAGD
jgi:hypothetical protein